MNPFSFVGAGLQGFSALIDSLFKGLSTLTSLNFWLRAGQMLLAVVMVGAGGMLLFRRAAPVELGEKLAKDGAEVGAL